MESMTQKNQSRPLTADERPFVETLLVRRQRIEQRIADVAALHHQLAAEREAIDVEMGLFTRALGGEAATIQLKTMTLMMPDAAVQAAADGVKKLIDGDGA